MCTVGLAGRRVGGVRHTTGLHHQLLLDANLAAEEVDVTKLQAEDLSPAESAPAPRYTAAR
jgi:hypothetical protein